MILKFDIEHVLICGASGAYLIWNSLKLKNRVRQLEDTPLVRSATSALGFAQIQGFAWPKEPPVRSRSGKQLVYYSFVLQEQISERVGAKRIKRWITVFSKRVSPNFYLLDPTGLVEIPIETAELDLKSEKTRRWWQLGKEEKRFFADILRGNRVLRFPPSDFFGGLFSTSFRVIEAEIALGTPLCVSGYLTKEVMSGQTPAAASSSPRATTTVAASYNQVVRLKGLTKFAKMVFDDRSRSLRKLDSIIPKDKDGKVSELDYKAVYTSAGEVALRHSAKSDFVEQDFFIHGCFASTTDHQLLIADTHQKQLSERLSKKIYFQFLVGFLLITGALIWGIKIFSQLKY